MRRLADPARDQFGGQVGATLPRLQERILQNLGAVVDANDDLRCVLDQPPALEAMQWHQDRVWRDNCAPQPPQRTGRNLVTLGKVAMWEQGSWQLATLTRDIGTQFEWDLAIYPRGKQRNTVATTDGWGLWSGTKAPDQAWDVMRFLQSDEWNEVVLTKSDYQPSRKSFADRWIRTVKTAIAQLRDQNVSAFVHGIANNYARPNAVFRFDDDVRPQLQQAINQTVDQNAAPLADTIRAAVAAANARLKQLAGG
jgi:ABC-type glycerol-3-phosphate transport system substrate-binding protein